MAAIYNLRSELVTVDALLSNSLSHPGLSGNRHGRTRTNVQSKHKTENASRARDSMDTENSRRDLTSGIMQERTYRVDENYTGGSNIELQEITSTAWSPKN